jgi:DNA ligase-associated metallophosphoesterase
MTDASVEIHGEHLRLLPERAIYWERLNMLLIADVHLGKAATFRAYRVPLPEGSAAADLERLSQALARTNAETLIVLGDLIHAAKGRDEQTLQLFHDWRNQHNELNIMLVRGNHDQRAGDPPASWGIHSLDGPMLISNFVLNHVPVEPDSGYALVGHLHPAVQLKGRARQSLKLPCFWLGSRYGVLPAFGSFIEHSVIQPHGEDSVFAVASNSVIAFPPR